MTSFENQKIINPFAVRFTRDNIRVAFQDGQTLEDSPAAMTTQPGDGKNYDLIVCPPFPSIKIAKSAMQGGLDQWITFDNHRLYCLQRYAASFWPARVAAIVDVYSGVEESWATKTQGMSVNIWHCGVGHDHLLGHWDWQVAVKKISQKAASAGSVNSQHILAAVAVSQDCVRTELDDLMGMPVRAPPGLEIVTSTPQSTQISLFQELLGSSESGSNFVRKPSKSSVATPSTGASSNHDSSDDESEDLSIHSGDFMNSEPQSPVSTAHHYLANDDKAAAYSAETHDETLMMRGIPCSFSQEDVMSLIDDAGLKGKYNFFYLPLDGSKKRFNLGYAFINFVDQESAEHCKALLNGVKLAPLRSHKTCTISPADIQGLPSLRKHFQRTSVSKASNGPLFLNTETETASQQKPAKKQDHKKGNKAPAIPNDAPGTEATTLMMKGIPCSFTQEALMSLVDDAGLKGKYNFFYLPFDSDKNANLGYAFINLVDQKSAELCTTAFKGVALAPFRSAKTCSVAPANVQGLPSLRKHFRNKAVKHHDSEKRPLFFKV